MKAVVLDEPGRIDVRDVADPDPGPGQIVVEVGACGVCGTDLHIVDGEFPPTPYPIIPGHEFAGQVVAVGPGVPDGLVTLGEHVAVDPSLFCGYCELCRVGRGNLCANWGAIGDTVDGAFAEYVAVPAVNAYRLPPGIDDRRGALVEPLSCAVHGLNVLGPVVGSRLLIVGAGTMGLLLQQLVLEAGARSVTMVDRSANRLDTARALGASEVTTDLDDLDDSRFDVGVDATGAGPVIEAVFDRLDRGGRLLVFGVASETAEVALSPFRIYNDELTILGSMAVLHSFGEAVELIDNGSVDVASLLQTPAFPLADYADAVQAVRDGKGLKVQVSPQQ